MQTYIGTRRQLRLLQFVSLVMTATFYNPAGAALVTFAFAAEAQYDNQPAYDIPAGMPLQGTFTFDSATPKAPASSTAAYYFDAIQNFNVDLEGVGTAHNTGTAYIYVGAPTTIFSPDPVDVDYYSVYNVPMTGLTVGGLFGDNTLVGAFITLEDTTQTAFSSDALPITPPNLALFSSSILLLNFRTPDGGTSATSFVLTSLIQVPEPSTLILAALGGLALLAVRRRRTAR